MAEALFNLHAAGTAKALSAGTLPAAHIDEVVVGVMNEIGIDLSEKRPRMLRREMVEDADRVVSMGCGTEDVCPAVFTPTEDWQLEDPQGKPIEKIREIRDEINVRVKRLVEEIHNQGR